MLKRQNSYFLCAFSCILLLVLVLCFLTSCKSVSSLEGQWFCVLNDSIYVELDANATTGYEWTVFVEGSSIEILEEEYVPNDAPLGMVGVGGTWKCKLGIIGDGQSTLHFVYARPWDNSSVAETRSLLVSVANGKVSQIASQIQEVPFE